MLSCAQASWVPAGSRQERSLESLSLTGSVRFASGGLGLSLGELPPLRSSIAGLESRCLKESAACDLGRRRRSP